MKTTPFALVTATLCLGFAACDSKQEKARKAEIEAHADSLENKAGAVRDQTKTDANNLEKVGKLQAEADKDGSAARMRAEKQAAEDAAKNLKKAGEATADSLEDKAKQVRDAK